MLQLCGKFLVWLVISCYFKWDETVNDFDQNLQRYNFWPVWICLCFERLLDVPNDFPHSMQTKAFCFSWTVRMWVCKLLSSVNDFSQISHRWDSFKWTDLLCWLRLLFCPKHFHTSDKQFFSFYCGLNCVVWDSSLDQ